MLTLMIRSVAVAAALLHSSCARPPTEEASAETREGAELRRRLHAETLSMQHLDYRQVREALKYTDEDPENPDNVILFYSGWSVPKSRFGGHPDQWNREHVWAKGRGRFGTAPGAGTDLHHIRATDVSVNARRGHLDFDDGGQPYADPNGRTACRVDADSWSPRPAVRGDVARMLFYMAVRYEGGDGELDLELVEKVNPKVLRAEHGRLSTLLRWHAEDPPDDAERRRHERIHERQGNRNPFVDHPGFALEIWN